MAGKQSIKCSKSSWFFQDTRAYIPYAVIGIFIVLAATFTSVYLMKMDSEVAETIYTTEKNDPRQTAISLVASDLARCLNYAGTEALEWQGEHPVILPAGAPVERFSEDNFMVIPQNQNLEKGDKLQISINLPSDVWGKVESLWKNRDVVLIVNDSAGQELKRVNYGQATGFLQKVSFDEYLEVPETAESGYASIELYYGDELKASDWFRIEASPIKDIAAEAFNRLLSANYQGNSHTFMEYAINVEPDIEPEQIRVRKVNGTLQREISSADKNYTIYYIFEIPLLNYTLVDLESGETLNMSMNLSTLITSREPLLEELVREYETALGTSSSLDSTSNIVLGATNLRTFIYGPWQHYAHGPLNILTNPALASSVNGATLYTQKKVFDSVDPLALTYTTYYNGKVLYEDVRASSSAKPSPSLFNSTCLNSSGTFYETDEDVNLTTTYASLAENRSFSLDVEGGIEESLAEVNTSYDELSEYSEITVSASDYTEGVLDGWVFNDHEWEEENPDLIHDVADSVYTAPVQGQIRRDGLNSPDPLASTITENFDLSSVSYSGHTVSWDSDYLASGTHAGSLVPSYSWSNPVTNSYSETMDPEIDPPRGSLVSWSVSGASVSLLSSNINELKVAPHYTYTGNDRLTVENRSEGYLSQEDHIFDWGIRYDISYKITTTWRIGYSYDYTYKWKTFEGYRDPVNKTGPIYETHTATSSGSDSKTTGKTDPESLFHTETESENLTIIYHQRPPTGGYTGISTYTDPTEREYMETTLYTAGAERFDPCCSDAADKYRDAYVNLRTLESAFWTYPDGMYLAQRAVNCDIPPWLHRVMGEEVLAMLDAVESDNPTFSYSLLDSPGQDPTDLQVETAEKLIFDLEANREAYVNKEQHLTSSGDMYTSSDSARYIARNEAYNRLLDDIEQKNKKLDSDLNSYILDALEEKGLSTGAFDSVTSGPMTLFDNPAIDMAASALGQEMGIISTMKVTGQPESKYNWTENLTLIVDQKPNYLYHDPDFDLRGEYKLTDSRGRVIYPLGVRNTCIFTTNISEEIADAISSSGEYVKTETSRQISQSISTLNTEVFLMEQNLSEQGVSLDTAHLNTEVYNLKLVYAREMRLQITEEVAAEVSSNHVVSGWIEEDRVRAVTISYLNSLSDEEIIEKSTTGQLATELAAAVITEIRNSNPPVEPDELEATLNRVDTDVRIGVADGICSVTESKGEALDILFGKIDGELKNMANETVDRYSGEIADKVTKRLDRTMAAVPCGLPVLPPHWIFTVNVWTYEVIGKYEEFTVIDNDNEVIPQPYFGHKGQKYVREYSEIYDPIKTDEFGYNVKLGENKIINFKLNGYATSIVGPGPRGVGDKSCGHTEESVAYGELFAEYGA
ncbi:hypothetical protein MSLAZ_0701 [Methanosarcina lacustris Z-7289]|uniref:Uncharacterized protein n=1 Tax=Methanosarcina lacustris Z-7289 TaxID=1434111 RepID=A0A0E3S478_9EURY|nr:hypothetical protein [Methanosarcina lacustris]AKB73962.1 hypothetical protein MSLAZ_0701 [Methanosarcina lacustris Z-7289]